MFAQQRCDILVTNDDGIHAPGLAALKQALQGLGEVLVVAPDTERSAVGHAITMRHPLRVFEDRKNGERFGLAVTGTPADCVKWAVHTLLESPPKLVVSGINPGPNQGTDVLYSGTVSAASEGSILGIPGLAVSLRYFDQPCGFEAAGLWARRISEQVLAHGLPSGVLLNCNVPGLPENEIKGLRVTRLAQYRLRDRYDQRQDPSGREYYWLAGDGPEVLNPGPDIDADAVSAGYVSLTPLRYDMTSNEFLPTLKQWFDPKK